MPGCTTPSPAVNKACSGKCRKDGGCDATPHVWVVAACEGMISLFERDMQGALLPIPKNGHGVFATLAQFQALMDKAEQAYEFDRLIIIGSRGDIAWIEASLSRPIARHITAEIEYPLLPAWFKQPLPLSHLTHALENIFCS